jgi:RNA polymerase sigma-70 factor (ECF subfamily)
MKPSRETDLKVLGEALHRRLLTRADNRVAAEISVLFLPPLAQSLKRHFQHLLSDPQEAESAAIESLVAYLAHPEKFDPAKSSLIGYLYLDAKGNLLNLLKQQKKLVELRGSLAEYEAQADETENPESRLLSASSPLVERVLAAIKDPTDRELVALMIDGVRETSAYAAVLGIADRLQREQKKIVKRHKDRLKKKLRRDFKRVERRQR